MNTLSKNEWIAVIVALLVVGFFFIFGQNLLAIFIKSPTTLTQTMQNQTLQVQDTVVGTGDTAQPGDRVTVNYTGKFPDGKVFDSSVARNEPFQFVLGANQVIKGWDQGIVGMKVGGKRTLTVPPDLGYGASDYGPIPGGSTLIFDVELLKVDKQ